MIEKAVSVRPVHVQRANRKPEHGELGVQHRGGLNWNRSSSIFVTDSLRVRTTAFFGSAVPQALSGVLPWAFLPVSKIPLECKNCVSVIKPSNFHKPTWIQHASFLQLHRNKLTFHQCNQSLDRVRVVIWKVVSSNPSSYSHHDDNNRGPRFIDFVISRSIFRTMHHRKHPDLLTLPNDESRRSYVMTTIRSVRTCDHPYRAQAKLFHLCLYFYYYLFIIKLESGVGHGCRLWLLSVVVVCGCYSRENVCIPQKWSYVIVRGNLGVSLC